MKKFKTIIKAKKYLNDLNDILGANKVRRIKNAIVWKYCVCTELEWLNM